MSKLKVGDKVRVRRTGLIGTISRAEYWSIFPYMIENDIKCEPFEGDELELVESTREFILIHSDGGEVVADRTPPVAGSSFDERAKLAFDRLVGREEPKPNTAAPAPKFRVGDRVTFGNFGNGTVKYVWFHSPSKCYTHMIAFDSGVSFPLREELLSPAPESKYYTGKIVMISCQYPDRKPFIGRLFEFKNGKYVGEKVAEVHFFGEPYKSFNDIAKIHHTSSWIEVKE